MFENDIDATGIDKGIAVAHMVRRGSWRIPSFMYVLIPGLEESQNATKLSDHPNKILWNPGKKFAIGHAYLSLRKMS